MNIKVLATGSSGNCYLIKGYREKILLEAGISFDRIMSGIDFDIKDLYCFISHEHKDHAKEAKKLVEIGVDVYMSEGTFEALGMQDCYNLHKIKHSQLVELKEFNILPFDVIHDVKEPLGFLIHSKIEKKNLLFITDTKDVPYSFSDVDGFMVEVNFDDETINNNIESGRTIPFVGNRARQTHLSLKKASKFLRDVKAFNKKIIPIHQSNSNLNFKILKREIEKIGEFIDISKKKEFKI